MKKDQRHSNIVGTSKATKTQSGTLCLNTQTSKKVGLCLSNSTPQAGTTSKRESLHAGSTDTTGKMSTKKTKNKQTSATNSLKGKSTKNSAGNAIKRNAVGTSSAKPVKRGYKKPCNHSYELSVPYSLEGKKSVKQYYRNKKGKYVCHWKCTNCSDRTITWSTDHKIPVFKLNQKYE